jgi:membrane protein DedA with SNARE-associated domain
VHQLTQDLGIWAYVLLALLVIVEGPVATLAGAVAASAGWMRPVGVFFSASVANLLADLLWYTLGYLGRMEWVHRYGGYVGLREEYLLHMMDDVQKYAPRLLFIAKITLGFSIPTLVATGLARVPIRRWFWVLILGETLWTGTLVYLGVRFGQYVQRLERGIEIVALVGALLFVSGLVYYITRIRRRSEKAKEKAIESANVKGI